MRPLVLAGHDGSLMVETTHGPRTAIGAGALRWRGGPWAGTQCALVEEGTTNLVTNPYGVAYSATLWGGTGATTVASVPALPWVGTAYHIAARFVPLAIAPLSGAGPAGTAITISGWHRHLPASGRDGLVYRMDLAYAAEATSAMRSTEFATTKDGVWRSQTWSRTTQYDDLTAVSANIEGYPAENDGVWESTAIQIEVADHATSPCPETDELGVLLPGYQWTGAANASASTRAAASITIACAETVGSLACRYSEDGGETWGWHYSETLGTIGDYGDISRDGDDLVVTSDRALLLGPLAVWADTLTAGEQDALAGLARPWTRRDVGWPGIPLYVMGSTGLTAARRVAVRSGGVLVDQ